jgi:hypothetical protein
VEDRKMVKVIAMVLIGNCSVRRTTTPIPQMNPPLWGYLSRVRVSCLLMEEMINAVRRLALMILIVTLKIMPNQKIARRIRMLRHQMQKRRKISSQIRSRLSDTGSL